MKTKHHPILSTPVIQSDDQTQNNSIRCRWFAVGLGGVFAVLALLPCSVEAQCKQWNAGHGWRFKQGSTIVDMNLQQNGTVITGSAVITNALFKKPGPSGAVIGGLGDLKGTVDGTVEGDSFAVKIYWDNNTIGVYEGTIRPSGKIEGKGWEQRSPRTKVRWYSETRMVCADATAVEPTNPPPPPLKSTGKVPANPPPPPIKSSGKAKTSTAAPTIKAQPILVTIPDGQSHGRTTLTWDGGPDHPDAEVWMRGSSQEETLVVQQGKGTRSVTVELGQNYRFILKDAGEVLAQAAVLTKSRP